MTQEMLQHGSGRRIIPSWQQLSRDKVTQTDEQALPIGPALSPESSVARAKGGNVLISMGPENFSSAFTLFISFIPGLSCFIVETWIA